MGDSSIEYSSAAASAGLDNPVLWGVYRTRDKNQITLLLGGGCASGGDAGYIPALLRQVDRRPPGQVEECPASRSIRRPTTTDFAAERPLSPPRAARVEETDSHQQWMAHGVRHAADLRHASRYWSRRRARRGVSGAQSMQWCGGCELESVSARARHTRRAVSRR